jgi:hypothetical protein
MVRLTDQTPPDLRDRLPTPGYDRSALQVGIVHLEVGGFHRTQAIYLDRLMNQGARLDWAIDGVGVLASASRMRDALGAQDGLHTLVEKGAEGTWAARVIGSIAEYLLAPDDPEPNDSTQAWSLGVDGLPKCWAMRTPAMNTAVAVEVICGPLSLIASSTGTRSSLSGTTPGRRAARRSAARRAGAPCRRRSARR